MATPINNTKPAPKADETPIFFEVLKDQSTTLEAFREDTRALDPQSWQKAVEEQ